MDASPKRQRGPYKGRLEGGGKNANLAINSLTMARLRAASAPSHAECRAMLITLRKTLRLTQGQLAAIIGAPYGTVRDWEDGSSGPSTIARHRINEVFRELGPTMRKAREIEQNR